MRYRIALSIVAAGLALAGCGQQAVTPTAVPATVAQPTAVAATVAASPSAAPLTATPATGTATSIPSPSGAAGTPTTVPAAASPTGSSATPPAGRVTDTPPTTVPVASPAAAAPQQIAELAQRSLVALPEVGPRNLTVQSIEAQDWSDSSLGCPDPAAIYLAVITPGYKIMLSDGATEYAVHTNIDGSTMVWCKDRLPVSVVAAQ